VRGPCGVKAPSQVSVHEVEPRNETGVHVTAGKQLMGLFSAHSAISAVRYLLCNWVRLPVRLNTYLGEY